MRVEFEASGSIEGLMDVVGSLCEDDSVGGIILLTCDANGFVPETLSPILTRIKKPFVGGVFPYILHGTQHYDRGTVAIGFPGAFDVAVISELSSRAEEMEQLTATLFDEQVVRGGATMLVLVDGFSTAIAALVDALFATFGLELNFLGGGAGSLSLQQGPCILTRQGMLTDAAVLALSARPSSVGVAHGWTPISEPLRVTAAHGNVVESLDWRPALAAYRDLVEPHAGHALDVEAFFDTAKAYPLGITKLGGELVVRDPLNVEGDALVCVGEVPVGSFVRVLHGTEADLLAAARNARVAAVEGAAGLDEPAVRLFIDCVSRVLFLGEYFDQELEMVHSPDTPLVGALTLGEIANSGQDYLEFFNKTSVVGIL